MEKFVINPSIDFFEGIRVTKDTDIKFENEHVFQTVKDLMLETRSHAEEEDFSFTQDSKLKLHDGDILLFEETGRGYFKPSCQLVTPKEAEEIFKCIQE